MSNRPWCLGAVLLVALALPVRAQVTIPDEYGKLITHRGEITAFGNEGFGDKIDLGSGSLEIVQTDVDLKGSNALPVRVSRRFVAGDRFSGGYFGAWDLDIPYVHGIFGNRIDMPKGWRVLGEGAEQYQRCSRFSAPPDLVFQFEGHYLSDEYWHGNFLHLPGTGDQELLKGGMAMPVPADGKSYPVVTKDGAAVRCVGVASTSESGSQGEGFEVVTPDGMVYTLNHMVSRSNELISKPVSPFAVLGSGTSAPGTLISKGPHPTLAMNFTLPRVEVRIYPTKIADRFGNYVTYTWSSENPRQLVRISASDGRQITFAYSNGGVNVSDGSHTWVYARDGDKDTVKLPDGSSWSSDLGALSNFQMHTTGDGCFSDSTYDGPTNLTGSVTAPSGATAVFTMTPVQMGRSWVPWECVYNDGSATYTGEPKAFFNFAVVSKRITGPGLPDNGLSWSYAYGAPNGCWIGYAPACTSSSPTTRTMSVTGPDGVVNRYTFGNQFAVNEGLQLKVEYDWNGTSVLRTVETTYADRNAAPYSSFNGSSPRERGDFSMNDMRPQRKVVTTQQGRTFTWQVATGCVGMPYCFDAYARPTKVVKGSTP